MKRKHAVTPSDAIDPTRTNPDYEYSPPRRRRVPHRDTGIPVECIEIDGGKFWEMCQMGKEASR